MTGKIENIDGSEFRRDLVSGDWILVAAKRAKRPQTKASKRRRLSSSKKNCPFDDPQKRGTPPPLLWLPHPTKSYKSRWQSHRGSSTESGLKAESSFDNWWVQIIQNKYPALEQHKICPTITSDGPYAKMKGVGFHEVIITRDHLRRISEMTSKEVEILIYAYQERWRTLAREECIEYILIFHNQGPGAGATIFHPHSQLIALPIIPPDVAKSLEGSRIYFERHKKCVHCAMLEWERKKRTRVIYENNYFTVLAPFASRVSYETRIFPKRHAGNFEDLKAKERMALADAMIASLKKIKKAMNDPDYNFFIHTAPAKDGRSYYHWHIEILPKTSIWAGLELGTGVEVVAVSPEEAARDLKNS
ncbi:MAG: HIT domain-containing protein [Candidatus Niyogibacteria bacterium]|nr:MAG: HIT domain-containing protein [Candidatus Niyogibacteria bacterium]